MKRVPTAAVAATCLGIAVAAWAAEAEQSGPVLDVKQTPPAVQAALKNEGARVSKIERETEGAQSYYEATVSKDGKNYQLHIADDGKIVKREDMPDKK